MFIAKGLNIERKKQITLILGFLRIKFALLTIIVLRQFECGAILSVRRAFVYF
ncbi:hypothetical protein FD09_GL000399 [Schleiferilactobacillus perolens DSM 12744]|uniref:Uncharacterized protein n=1 Tax=Schleiferilactobacillus perolens DSM 12744 TaxID=1423792 RepID=A0A0R1N8R0_9LACO|nr:hypothetical protein FD09_GL000399 [Schleiferilactobacillus perolens DSM 12744]